MALNKCQSEVLDYCTLYARKLTGNPNYTFNNLPGPIRNALFNVDADVPESKYKGWTTFLKESVRDELKKSGLRV